MNTFANWFAISLTIPVAAGLYFMYDKTVSSKASYLECWNGGNSILSGVFTNISASDDVTKYKMADGRTVKVYNATCVITDIPKEQVKDK